MRTTDAERCAFIQIKMSDGKFSFSFACAGLQNYRVLRKRLVPPRSPCAKMPVGRTFSSPAFLRHHSGRASERLPARLSTCVLSRWLGGCFPRQLPPSLGQESRDSAKPRPEPRGFPARNSSSDTNKQRRQETKTAECNTISGKPEDAEGRFAPLGRLVSPAATAKISYVGRVRAHRL